jgi:hypothetical protein
MKISPETTLSQLEIRLRALGLGLSVQFVASERLLEAFVTSLIDDNTGSARGETIDEAINDAIDDWARRFVGIPGDQITRRVPHAEAVSIAIEHTFGVKPHA